MKVLLFFIFILTLCSGCSNFTAEAQTKKNEPSISDKKDGVKIRVDSLGPANEREISEIELIKEKERKELERIPQEFRQIDFKNFTYPDIFPRKESKTFTLKDGKFTYENRKEYDNRTYQFKNQYFADVNGDSKPEAIVHIIQTMCGSGSCDSYTSFYFFEIKNGQPNLLWKIATGAEDNCGLMTFMIENEILILETSNKCFLENERINSRPDPEKRGKWDIDHSTLFIFSMKNNFNLEWNTFLRLDKKLDFNFLSEININGVDYSE